MAVPFSCKKRFHQETSLSHPQFKCLLQRGTYTRFHEYMKTQKSTLNEWVKFESFLETAANVMLLSPAMYSLNDGNSNANKESVECPRYPQRDALKSRNASRNCLPITNTSRHNKTDGKDTHAYGEAPFRNFLHQASKQCRKSSVQRGKRSESRLAIGMLDSLDALRCTIQDFKSYGERVLRCCGSPDPRLTPTYVQWSVSQQMVLGLFIERETCV